MHFLQRPLRFALALAVYAFLGGASVRHVRADAPARGPALNWVRLPGAESCIAPVELAGRVEARLGRPVFVRTSDAIVVIEGRVGPATTGGFAAVLQVSDPDGTLYGTREVALADADCRKLDDIVALIIAVTIHHGSAGTGIALPPEIARELDRLFEEDGAELDPATLPAPVPPPIANETPRRTAHNPNQPPPDKDSPVRVDFGAGFGFESGLQPDFTIGPAIGVRMHLAGIGSAKLSGGLGLSREQAVDAGALEYDLMKVGLELCIPSWQAGPSELAVCVASALGNLHIAAEGFRKQNPKTDHLWVEVGPELSTRTMVWGPLFIELALAVQFRVLAPELTYRDMEGAPRTAFSVAHAGLSVELGAGVRF